jgi:hypothetical protein
VDGKLKQLPVKGPFVTELRQIVVV